MIIDLKNIKKYFGGDDVICDISLKIEDDDRIGLIGANGAGKTTLLNIICGVYKVDEGEVIGSSKTIGYLKQNAGLDTNETIYNEMRKVFSDLLKKEERLNELYAQIAEISDHSSLRYKELTDSYSRIQTEFEQKDGYNIDVKINTILNGMGFLNKDRDTITKTLSGGEKTRLALCKLLLEQPDLLILDEPTNHLDFKTLNWLEDYLKSYKGALLMVSHDRYFLDKLVTSIAEIYKGRLIRYKGNYSKFTSLKEERMENMLREYEKQQNEIASLKEYVEKNMARASTAKSAKGREKTLEKMVVLEKPTDYLKSIKLNFSYKLEPVKDVLDVTDLTLKIENRVLSKNLNFSVKRGDKIAIVGENGVGKTSFLKAILGRFPYSDGKVTWGRNVNHSFFEQETTELNEKRTILNEVWDRYPAAFEQEIRNTLGSLLLTGEEVYKPIGVLSGGEKAKVKFAIMMLKHANVLIFDEPTNHLDLSAKEVLDKALFDYEGTIIMVSHDRYLLNKVPNKIIEFTPKEVFVYDGKYDDYVAKKDSMTTKDNSSQKEVISDTKNSYYRSKSERAFFVKIAKEIKKTEDEIAKLEEENRILENEIASPEFSSNFEALNEKCLKLTENKESLNKLYEDWDSLQIPENGN